MSLSLDDADASGRTEEELSAMTVTELKALADSLGIELTATKKADIINEILAN